MKMNQCLRSLIALATFSGCAAAQLAAAHEIKAIAPDCASLSRKTQLSNERVNSLALAKGYKIIRFWEHASGKLVLWPLFFSVDRSFMPTRRQRPCSTTNKHLATCF